MRRNIVTKFEALTADEINQLRPGNYSDYELIDVANHFSTLGDNEREFAVRSLLLHSPEVSEMLAYNELYYDQVLTARRLDAPSAMLQWAYAAIGFEEQQNAGDDRTQQYRELAEAYFWAAEFNAGFQLLARLLRIDPSDIWLYNTFATTLPEAGFPHLAVGLIERGLQLIEKEDPENLREQLERHLQKAKEQAATEPDRTGEIDPEIVTEFQAALSINLLDVETPFANYLPAVAQLVEQSKQVDAQASIEILYDEITDNARVYTPDLIRLAFDLDLDDSNSSTHAVTLLRQFHKENLIELDELSGWLGQADGEWQTELLSEHIGKIGGIETETLKNITADLDYDEFLRQAAIETLIERTEHTPSLRDELVEFMRMLLTRREAIEVATEERFIGMLISDILDFGAKELFPEIEAAFVEDRVAPQIIGIDSVVREWGMGVMPESPNSDDLRLLLSCKQCGRERFHIVEHVTLDMNTREKQEAGKTTKYDPYVMDREIVCPKCGAIDQYALTSMATMRLHMTVRDDEDGNLGGNPFQPDRRLQSFRSMIQGKPLHPLEGIDFYRRQITANPDNASNHMKLGNLYRTLYRNQDALEIYRQAYALDSQDSDIVIVLAMAEHDFGDKQKAQKLYDEVKALAANKPLFSTEGIENMSAAMSGLSALKRNKPSPWGIEGDEDSQSVGRSDNRATQKRAKRTKRKKPGNTLKKLKKKKRKRK